jgi:hypothetical protein
MEEKVDPRLKWGIVLTLDEFRQAYREKAGYCRGCKIRYPDIDHTAKALPCSECGRPRVFGAVQYVWNGWVKELPPYRWRRNVDYLLKEDSHVGSPQ